MGNWALAAGKGKKKFWETHEREFGQWLAAILLVWFPVKSIEGEREKIRTNRGISVVSGVWRVPVNMQDKAMRITSIFHSLLFIYIFIYKFFSEMIRYKRKVYNVYLNVC